MLGKCSTPNIGDVDLQPLASLIGTPVRHHGLHLNGKSIDQTCRKCEAPLFSSAFYYAVKWLGSHFTMKNREKQPRKGISLSKSLLMARLLYLRYDSFIFFPSIGSFTLGELNKTR